MKLTLIESGGEASGGTWPPIQHLFSSLHTGELNRELRLLLPASLAAIFQPSQPVRAGIARSVCVCLARNAAPLNYPSYLPADILEETVLREAKRIISIMSRRVYTWLAAH